jgi:hypothetical protein
MPESRSATEEPVHSRNTDGSIKSVTRIWSGSPMRRLSIAGGVVAGTLLISTLVLVGSDRVDELSAPPVAADPIRAVPATHAFSTDCGVSQATLDALVPEAERRRSQTDACEWATARSERERYLSVSITLGDSSQQSALGTLGTTPTTNAMGAFVNNVTQLREKKMAVNGLGDEGRAYYPADRIQDGGGSIIVRARNVIVKTNYRSGTYAEEQLSGKSAMDGALRATTDVVRGLGVPVHRPPSIGPLKADAMPARSPGDPCKMVSPQILEKLIEEPEQSRDGDITSSREGKNAQTCSWKPRTWPDNYAYYLQVVLTPHPSLEAAERSYRTKHIEARAEEPISKENEKYFTAVAGLGEQAYAAFVEEGSPGGVVFRVRNVVAIVTYSQTAVSNAAPGDSKPLTRQQSVNGAYAAAKDVAAALRN